MKLIECTLSAVNRGETDSAIRNKAFTRWKRWVIWKDINASTQVTGDCIRTTETTQSIRTSYIISSTTRKTLKIT